MTDEDFITMFGMDRDSYDKKLCDNEYNLLKKREEEYEAAIKKEEYIKTFIGKYYKNEFNKNKNKIYLITDIRYTAGYPENFPMYYSLYTTDKDGLEVWIINLPESDFNDTNPYFLDTIASSPK